MISTTIYFIQTGYYTHCDGFLINQMAINAALALASVTAAESITPHGTKR